MPRETDEGRLRRLLEAFSDAASNVPEFSVTAMTGGARVDAGLIHLLEPELTDAERRRVTKRAIVDFLRKGGAPNRKDEAGDATMGFDASTYYEFRITAQGVRLFIKVAYEEIRDETSCIVVSVKRDDSAQK